jgi:hypothetical protein
MHSNPPPPNRHTKLIEALAALPRVGDREQLLTREAALAAFFELKNMHSGLSNRVDAHIGDLVGHATDQLEPVPDEPDTFVVTELELRGILSGAIILGAMQTAYDLGMATIDVRQVQEILGGQLAASGEYDGGEGQKHVV